jgi:hypothetical protein
LGWHVDINTGDPYDPMFALGQAVLGGPGEQRIRDVVVTCFPPSLTVTGTIEGQLNAGPGAVSQGGKDAFVFVLENQSGMLDDIQLDAARGVIIGGPGDQIATGVARDEQGRAIVVGNFEGSISIRDLQGNTYPELGTVTAADGEDLFVVTFAADGTPSALLAGTAPGVQRAHDVAIRDGLAVVVGELDSSFELAGQTLEPAAGVGRSRRRDDDDRWQHDHGPGVRSACGCRRRSEGHLDSRG